MNVNSFLDEVKLNRIYTDLIQFSESLGNPEESGNKNYDKDLESLREKQNQIDEFISQLEKKNKQINALSKFCQKLKEEIIISESLLLKKKNYNQMQEFFCKKKSSKICHN